MSSRSTKTLSRSFKKAFKFNNSKSDDVPEAIADVQPSEKPKLQISSPLETMSIEDKKKELISQGIMKSVSSGPRPPSRKVPPKKPTIKFHSLRTPKESSEVTHSNDIIPSPEPTPTSSPSDNSERPPLQLSLSSTGSAITKRRSSSIGADSRASIVPKKKIDKSHSKNVELTHKIFTYLCTRHPWFAENWYKENTEISDQTFQDLVAILSGEKTSVQVKVKEAWTKQEFNLNTNISIDTIQSFQSMREELMSSLSMFIRDFESVLPSKYADFAGSKKNQFITRKPRIGNLEIVLTIFNELLQLIESIHSQDMVNQSINTLKEKIKKVPDFYVPDQQTIDMVDKIGPLFTNNLIIVQLQSFLGKLGSISTQIIQTISTINSESEIITHRTIMEILSCIGLSIKNIKRILGATATSFSISEFSTSKVDLTMTPREKEMSVNIWDYVRTSNGKEENMKSATMNGLVLKLTDPERIDPTFLKNFFTTYRSFATPEQLFYKLLERYSVPDEFSASKTQVQLRVCVALKYWLDVSIRDFGHGLISDLRKFIEETLQADGHTALSGRLSTSLAQSIEKEQKRPVYTKIAIILEKPFQSSTDIFINSSAKDIAQQMTVLDSKVFMSVEVTELLNLAWSKPKLKHLAPHVLSMIERSNCTAHWVATTIMFHEKLKERSLVIAKFIDIAHELYVLQNFDSLMGVLAGLNLSSVSRLKFSNLSLNDSSVTLLEEVKALMEPQSSWSNYRNHLKSIVAPAIPYMGVYLTDLTFIEDGNADTSDDTINFRKRELVGRVLQDIQVFQQTPYKIEATEPLSTYLIELPFMDQEVLYTLSLQREPRNSTFKDLL